MQSPSQLPVRRFMRHFDFLLHAPKRELIKGAFVVAVITAAGVMFSNQYGLFLDFSEMRCMPEYVYLGYPKTHELHRGDLVSFVATGDTMLGLFNGKRIAKMIVGVPGDLVVSDEHGAFINGAKVAERNPLTLANMQRKNAAPVNMNRRIEPGELFVVGTLPRAFDSRYWGVLPANRVDRMVKAVL